MSQHPVDRLIQDIAEGGRAAVENELVQISRYIGELGFSPSDLSEHYEKHVKRQKEWPEGTNDIEYVDSLRQVALDSRSGIALSQWWRQTQWHVTIMGRSGRFKGPGGSDWIAVEYRVGDESWATAFQPEAGLGHVDSHYRRRNVRWLRRPE